jgi:lysophospholipase L1-like esterase
MNRKLLILLLLAVTFQLPASAKRKPTVFIIGDSTVKNGKGDGGGGLWGWGDPIIHYFDTTRIRIENHALGGTSSRTFQTKGLWEKVRLKLKKGDFVLMQFGHNDNGPVNDTLRARGTIKGIGEDSIAIDNLITKQHEVVHSYGWYMRKMIRETKEKRAIPLIITPVPRDNWENGKIKRTEGSYRQWVIEIATLENIGVVDLNELVSREYEELGMDRVKAFFPADHTHTSKDGAELNAKIVSEEIGSQKKSKLRKYLIKQ